MQVSEEKYLSVLKEHLPQGTEVQFFQWVKKYNFSLRISRPRVSKLGDYRPPHKGKSHIISVNNDLNQYAFLITLVHEIAHLIVWEKHRHRVKPHGDQWKEAYKGLMHPFFEQHIFPEKIKHALLKYMSNPKASSCSDTRLTRVLRQFDEKKDGIQFLEELPRGTVFSLHGKRVFKKGEKLRKRFKCREVQTNREYLVSPLAEVKKLP